VAGYRTFVAIQRGSMKNGQETGEIGIKHHHNTKQTSSFTFPNL
jgi:hypothetical protein